MERRDFLKKIGLAGGAALAMPYILPSGRLFASTGARKVNHVVFCLFAGGVRNMESVHQNESNLMQNLFKDISGGFSAQSGINEILPPSPINYRLQEMGTLIKEMRFKNGPTGHFNGHVTALTGRYNDTTLNLRANPTYPTIFEYYRKHQQDAKTTDAWWISDSLGPYPLLNYSSYPGYGALYGANYIQASTMININGYNAIGNPKNLNETNEKFATDFKQFCDGNFSSATTSNIQNLGNTPEERAELKKFIDELFQDAIQGQDLNNWGFGTNVNNDLRNIYYAEKVLTKFKPELLVLNMQNVDICHSDFTQYCNLLRRADWGVAHLWNTIQSTPGLANETVLIVAPEHGRNLEPNTLVDAYGRKALDHTNDNTSREVFCMICGPDNVVQQNQLIDKEYGETIDIVPTIADLLGFKNNIPNGLLQGKVLTDALK